MKKFFVTAIVLSVLLAGNLYAGGGKEKAGETKQPQPATSPSGWLGIHSYDPDNETMTALKLSGKKGALVMFVVLNSPADSGGIRPGDFITGVNRREVEGTKQLLAILGGLRPGERAAITMIRDGASRTIEAVIAARTDQSGSNTSEIWPGVTAYPLTTAVREQLKLGRNTTGVYAMLVTAGSPAASTGIQQGDIITAVSGEPVNDLAAYYKQLRVTDRELWFNVIRNGAALALSKFKKPAPSAPAQPSGLLETATSIVEETQQPQSSFTGDGGKGKSITIIPPRAAGLTAGQDYIPALVQGEFISNFSSYSAISVFNRQQLEAQYAELESSYYDVNAGSDIGSLPPTDYFMSGNITKTSTGYSLQISIANNADKMVAASYSGTCAFAELDNLTAVRKASADLLAKLNVSLTDTAKQELAAAPNTAAINAQTTLAQGITAQQKGTEVAALSYYIQSHNYDTGLAEAASRLNVLTANVTSGNIGANVRNDLEWRDRWIARLKECEDWYASYMNNPPPCYLVYSTDIKQGAINYEKRTVPLSFTAEIRLGQVLQWYTTASQVVQTVRQGLIATGRAQTWGLAGWALRSAENPFVHHLNGFLAEFEIVNSEGKSIAQQTMGFPCGSIMYGSDVAIPIRTNAVDITFSAVDPYDITDTLTIRISRIDGQPTEQIASQRNISIMTSAEYSRLPEVRGKIAVFDYIKPKVPIDTAPCVWYQKDSNTMIVVIPYGVTSISDNAFHYNDRSPRPFAVIMPNTVTSIDNFAFSGNGMTSVTIPDSVTSIGMGAFSNTDLKSITIPDSVTDIYQSAFRGTDLTSITIGANVRMHVVTDGGIFPDRFDDFYNRNGKKAGTYTYNESTKQWSFKAR
jgi:hypothetical protein